MNDIISLVGDVFNVVIVNMKLVLNTIVAEPLLLTPIIISLFGGITIFAIKKIRALGVRAGGGGKRRRR